MTPDAPGGEVPDAPPPPRPGYFRVSWSVDLPKDEFPAARDAAVHACELAGDCSGPANVFTVIDGDDGTAAEYDLAP